MKRVHIFACSGYMHWGEPACARSPACAARIIEALEEVLVSGRMRWRGCVRVGMNRGSREGIDESYAAEAILEAKGIIVKPSSTT